LADGPLAGGDRLVEARCHGVRHARRLAQGCLVCASVCPIHPIILPLRFDMSDKARASVLPLLAIVLTALNLRTTITKFTPLLDTIGADLDFGPSLYGVFGTIVTACFAVFGLVAAPVARRLGLER